MIEDKLNDNQVADDTDQLDNTFINSTEETVCAPEFPAGCIDVEQ